MTNYDKLETKKLFQTQFLKHIFFKIFELTCSVLTKAFDQQKIDLLTIVKFVVLLEKVRLV